MNIKIAGLALTAVLALAACGSTTPKNPGNTLPAGVMFTLPSADTTYTVMDSTGATVQTTDADMSDTGVDLTGLAQGDYTITFSRPGFQTSAPVAFTVDASGAATVTVPDLTPTPTGGTAITGLTKVGSYAYSGVVDRDTNTPGVQVYPGDYIQAVFYGTNATAAAITGGYLQVMLPDGTYDAANILAAARAGAQDNVGNPLVGAPKTGDVKATIDAAAKTATSMIDVAAGQQVVMAAQITPTAVGNYCFKGTTFGGAPDVCFTVIAKP